MMIANFFNKTKPIQAIFIFGLFLIYYLLTIFIIEKPEFSWYLLLEKMGVFVMFLALFFIVSFINKKNTLTGLNSYLILFLAIFFGVFPKTMSLQPLFIAHFFLLFAFRRTYSIKSNKNISEKVFDSAFWIGVSSLFYMWSTLFLILVFVAIFIYKKQEVRNLIIPIVGYITPVFIAFTYYFVTDSNEYFLNKIMFEYSLVFQTVSLSTIVLGLLSIVGIVMISSKINSELFELKPSWLLVVLHFFIGVSIFLVSPQKDESEILFMFFPLAIICANYLQLFSGKVFKEIIVIGLLILSFSIYFL